jgi:hypothetical protein
VGRIGFAPGAGLSGATTAVATDAPTVSGSTASAVPTSPVALLAAPRRRFCTRRVWARTNSVRSRIVTNSGVAKKMDE